MVNNLMTQSSTAFQNSMSEEFKVLIYAPLWRDSAAGVKVLYLLCDGLNRRNIPAYIVPIGIGRNLFPKELHVLQIDERLNSRKALSQENCVVIYTETISNNPLSANYFIKYYLNYPELLNRKAKYEPNEISLPYSQNIGHKLKALGYSNIQEALFISSVNISDINLNFDKSNYILLYANKYRKIFGKPQDPNLISEYIEIFGSGRKKQDRVKVLNLLRNARSIISFENSAIVTEAILSGTPVFLANNDLTKNPIAEIELGLEGSRNLELFGKVEIPAEEFQSARTKFMESLKKTEIQLDSFVEFLKMMKFNSGKMPFVKIRNRYLRVFLHKISFVNEFLYRLSVNKSYLNFKNRDFRRKSGQIEK